MASWYKQFTGVETSVERLNEVEHTVLIELGFDFNFVYEPVELIRRYLDLLGYAND